MSNALTFGILMPKILPVHRFFDRLLCRVIIWYRNPFCRLIQKNKYSVNKYGKTDYDIADT